METDVPASSLSIFTSDFFVSHSSISLSAIADISIPITREFLLLGGFRCPSAMVSPLSPALTYLALVTTPGMELGEVIVQTGA